MASKISLVLLLLFMVFQSGRAIRINNSPAEEVEDGEETLQPEEASGSDNLLRFIEVPGGELAEREPGRQELSEGGAKWPEFANNISRLYTFKTWPKPNINVSKLAKAGMFYLGDKDRTECHHCGIRLHRWEIHDDPWIEHARFSPRCNFVHRHRGSAFVKAVQEFYQLPANNIENPRTLPVRRGNYRVPLAEPAFYASPPRNVLRRVDPRQIRARLDMDNVRMLIALGYPRELVGQVIRERLEAEGDDFRYFGDLVRAVMDAAAMLGIQLHTHRPVAHPPNADEDLDPVERNKRLKMKLYCKRCWKKEVNVVLLNCGHMVLCEDCAMLVHICPRCHNHILQRVKVFIP